MRKSSIRKRYQRGDVLGVCEFVREIQSTWKGVTRTRWGWFICPYCGNGFLNIIDQVKHGKIKSCNCLLVSKIKMLNYSHGETGSRLYVMWQNIKKRCYKNDTVGYDNYGGRGIRMCDEWVGNYEIFRDHIKSLPHYREEDVHKSGLTLDRIDNDGNYEPGNVRWVDRHVQAVNKRIQSSNTTGFVGVAKAGNGFAAYITVHKERINLGKYNNKIDAYKARCKYIEENNLTEYKV